VLSDALLDVLSDGDLEVEFDSESLRLYDRALVEVEFDTLRLSEFEADTEFDVLLLPLRLTEFEAETDADVLLLPLLLTDRLLESEVDTLRESELLVEREGLALVLVLSDSPAVIWFVQVGEASVFVFL